MTSSQEKRHQNFAFLAQFILPVAYDDTSLGIMQLIEAEQIIK